MSGYNLMNKIKVRNKSRKKISYSITEVTFH